jgi:DNA primase
VSIFETLRDRVSVEQVTGGRVGEKIRCLAHADNNTPNMHIYEDHVFCFACAFYGDVVALWQLKHGFERPIEAALDLAREFGVEVPDQSPQARKEAEQRRSKEETFLKQARDRHRALDTHPNVREWWERRGFDEELQRRFLLGANRDGTEAVIPFWHRGRIIGLIRRKLEGEPKYVYPKAEDSPEGRRPLFIPGPLRGGTLLVEGIVDALAAAALGESVIAVGGTNISAGQMSELERISDPIYILPDADPEGGEAARRWVRDLYPRAFLCPAEYGEGRKDVADFFATDRQIAAEIISRLRTKAADALTIAIGETPDEDSKRRQLARIRESVLPLILKVFDASEPAALLEPLKNSEVMAALADVAAATNLGAPMLRAALEEEAQRRLADLKSVIEGERLAEAKANRLPPEEYEHLLSPGVLDRYVAEAAKLQGVVGDEDHMRLISLVAFGAQLDLLPNDRPLGSSVVLIGESGRGKNYLTDAVVRLMPPQWNLAFESASAASFYYQVEQEPGFLAHRFVYPNEVEATDKLVEFLRPMLSSGKAVRLTVNKNDAGTNTGQELEVRGPITTIIPTVRNKLDEQLQTRLLVAELDDYVGRVKQHARAFSKLLLPDYVPPNEADTLRLWMATLESLAEVRRVVIPCDREEFALSDDSVSHGARLWANLLGLMCAHAWLEQRNRKIIELPNGERAVVASSEDYGAAYKVFAATSRRTVVNISDTHRKILNALYELQEENPKADGFSQRPIAEKACVKQGTVSKNKTFLVTSAKLLQETDHGLALVEGAEPSWWADDNLMNGFPSPEKVRQWWGEEQPAEQTEEQES